MEFCPTPTRGSGGVLRGQQAAGGAQGRARAGRAAADPLQARLPRTRGERPGLLGAVKLFCKQQNTLCFFLSVGFFTQSFELAVIVKRGKRWTFLDLFKFLAAPASRTWLRCQLPGVIRQARPPAGERLPRCGRESPLPVSTLQGPKPTGPALSTRPPTRKPRGPLNKKAACL